MSDVSAIGRTHAYSFPIRDARAKLRLDLDEAKGLPEVVTVAVYDVLVRFPPQAELQDRHAGHLNQGGWRFGPAQRASARCGWESGRHLLRCRHHRRPRQRSHLPGRTSAVTVS